MSHDEGRDADHEGRDEGDDAGGALEREHADVLAVLRRFTLADAPAGLEDRVALALKKPAEVTAERVREVAGVSLRCAFCHAGLERAGAVFCASCLAPHHADCFAEHGHCSAPGCDETRVVSPRAAGAPGAAPVAPRRARPRWRPLLVAAGLLLAGLVGTFGLQRWRQADVVRDEQQEYAEFKRLWDAGNAAFRDFNAAEKAGDAALAKRKWREAHETLVQAVDVLERLLAGKRGPDGKLPEEYAGYDDGLQKTAVLLVDLEKRSLDARPAPDPAPSVVDSHDDLVTRPRAAPAAPDLATRPRAAPAAPELLRALAEHDRAVAADPARADVWLARARARLEWRDLPGAVSDFDRALALDPRATPALSGRAAARFELGGREGALADVQRALELDPACAEAYRVRGRIHRQQQRLVDAVIDLSRCLELAPGDAEAWTLRGEARARLGELDAAESDLVRATQLDPSAPEPFYELARVHLDRDRREEAAQDLESFLRLAPPDHPLREAAAKLQRLARGRSFRDTR